MMSALKNSVLALGFLTFAACGGGGGSSGNNNSSSKSASSLSSIASSSSSVISSSSSSASSASVASLHTLADFPVGVAVSAGNESLSLLKETDNGIAQRAVVEAHFSQLTAGNIMKMSYLHPAENTYSYTQADALLDYATDHGISIHAHTLVWHSDYQVPSFMKNYVGDKTAWLALIDSHVTNIAGHFAGKVDSWDVVNEAFLDDGSYRSEDSVFYQKMGKDYIETAFKSARAADADVDLYYNDYSLSQNSTKINAVVTMVEDFQARSIPIDGVGFQMHIFMDNPSISAIKASFKKIVDLGLKVKITELDIPLNNPYGGTNDITEFTPVLAQAQKKRYCEVITAYMDTVPAEQRGGITVWGIWDSSSWLIDLRGKADWPLLFNDDFTQKPALQGVADGLTGVACL